MTGVKRNLIETRRRLDAAITAWRSRGLASKGAPEGWEWAALRSDLERTVVDSVEALQHAWSVGVPRIPDAGDRSSSMAGGAAAEMRASLEAGKNGEELWSAEIDDRVLQLAEDELLIDAMRIQGRLGEAEAASVEPSAQRPGLVKFLRRAGCLRSLLSLANGRADNGADPVWAEMEADSLMAFFDRPWLRGVRRRAARRGGAAWGKESDQLPDWITRALEEFHLSQGFAAFCSEWIIAQARAIHEATNSPERIDGMRAATRKLEYANAQWLVSDRRWAAREIARLEDQQEAGWQSEGTPQS